VAKKRSNGRSLDVADLVELVGALSNIRIGGNGHAEKLDPSVNVKELGELRAAHAKEIRDLDASWQKRLDDERKDASVARQSAEASRIDARLGDIVSTAALATTQLTNTATTLAKTVSDTAETARKTVEAAAQQQSELVGQVRDAVSTLRTDLTALVVGGGAERTTRQEQRQERQFTTGQIITVGTVAALILADLISRHVI
jgi:hypothetical protein